MFESHVPSNCFIHFPCWPKIKHKMIFYFHTNLQQIYSPSSNYSSRSIFQTSGKGEKERYTHLNVAFQRIARRDKKTFLSDQCKEIEESNRMGKTRDLFKNIRDTKGTFHAKMGSVKDRNGMDLTRSRRY